MRWQGSVQLKGTIPYRAQCTVVTMLMVWVSWHWASAATRGTACCKHASMLV